MPTKQIILFKKNLLDNYRYLASFREDIKISPVLKSNAYGHGIVEIGKILDKVKAPFFCVNSIEEAHLLRKNHIKTPILIMGYVDPEDLKKPLPYSYTIYNYAQLTAINKFQKGASVHIFIDSGMHREGFRIEKLQSLLTNLQNFRNIQIIGAMSHFASGDKPYSTQTQNQIKKFNSAIRIIENANTHLLYKHISASAGFLNFATEKGANIGNIARVGKALYGIDPRGENLILKPVLKFTTKLVQIKELKKNKRVGYDGTYATKKRTILGILPVGYFDGLDRRLSNKGSLLIDNTPCPIVGRISMNLTTIDITNLKNPRVGKEVIVLSNNSQDPNSVENFAKKSKTIPYDIAVRINPFIERICL